MIRYTQVCGLSPGQAYAYAIFRSGNAVVALKAPSIQQLDATLPVVLESLQAG